jgi:hypothetical protein
MTTTILNCPECRRENEPERIYCHGCGARLDRSTLAKKRPPVEKSEQIHRRLRRMFDPQHGRLRRVFFAFCKVVLAACGAAVLVEMASPPADITPASKTLGLARQINFDLENAMLYHRPPQLQYTQDEVNAYLAYTLKSKKRLLDKSILKFDRAIVSLSEGKCTITVERSLFGYFLYHRVSYGLNLKKGKIVVSYKGAWIGRLPIAPQVVPYTSIIFADLWSALNRERRLVDKMGGIDFHDGYVALTTPAR